MSEAGASCRDPERSEEPLTRWARIGPAGFALREASA